jgi:hypothetical protein
MEVEGPVYFSFTIFLVEVVVEFFVDRSNMYVRGSYQG